jgi:hypothetical protein
MRDCEWPSRQILNFVDALPRDRGGNPRRLLLQKSKKIFAAESPLTSLSHSKASQAARVGPSPQRSFADIQECRGLTDIEKLVRIGYLLRTQGFTQ